MSDFLRDILKRAWWVMMAGAVSVAQGAPPVQMVSKTMRVDHGRPVVMVRQKSAVRHLPYDLMSRE